jgi:gas vesicle protein
MSNNPEDIKRDIEATRESLSRDVDLLSEKVSPARVIERRVDRAKDAVSGVKDKVMGGTVPATGSGGNGGLSATQDKVAAAASSLADTATSAPDAARSHARGNPLAAGLIAFGVGWLASSLLPATQKEQEVAVAMKDKASEHSDLIKQPLAEAASELKENLREPTQQAVESVKSTAHEAAANVRDEGRSAAQEVKEDATRSREV